MVGPRKKRLTFYRVVTILAESTTGEYDMDPRNNIPQNGIPFSDEHLDWEDEFESEDFDYEYEGDDGDWMDADALASAGWGTDEDYGYYGGDEW
jgi:hypothetical protein